MVNGIQGQRLLRLRSLLTRWTCQPKTAVEKMKALQLPENMIELFRTVRQTLHALDEA